MQDVIVIGLGAAGAATLLALARAGIPALGIDRFNPPHDRGSSHGETRITRLAVGEGDVYAPLVRRSHILWRQLEAETGETLMLQSGGLILGQATGPTLHHGKTDFVANTIRIAQTHAIAHEVLNAADIVARFPQFRLRGDERGYYEPEAGLLYPERCVAAQLARAQALGAKIIPNTEVLALTPGHDSIAVTTQSQTHHAARAILTAGAWTPELAPYAVAQHLRVTRQALHWFAPSNDADFAPGRFPIFIWMHGTGVDDFFYGFPAQNGAVKVATERNHSTFDPNTPDRTVTPEESAAMHKTHVASHLPGLTSTRIRAAACLYTMTPDSNFLVHQPHPTLLTATACSGHGFKHSAAIGETLAAQILTKDFALERFA
jgi:sarcosine oxidase